QPVLPQGVPGASMLPFDERLTVDPQGNALYFRGRPDEISKLESLLLIVDVPNSLESKWYPLGRAARAIASEGQRQGLGDFTTEEGTGAATDPQQAAIRQTLLPFSQQSGAAGPGFVIYP